LTNTSTDLANPSELLITKEEATELINRWSKSGRSFFKIHRTLETNAGEGPDGDFVPLGSLGPHLLSELLGNRAYKPMV
jgi:hypothetical protein